MKSFKFILVAVTVLGLVACGKSKEIVALEEIVGTFNSELTACETVKKEVLGKCLNDASTKATTGWTENVAGAAGDVDEFTRLTAEFTAATQRYADMASKG